MTGSYEVSSVEETWALAKKFAATLRPGDVVCLEGDLGAGKTTFTQGLAAARRRHSASSRSMRARRSRSSCSSTWTCTA